MNKTIRKAKIVNDPSPIKTLLGIPTGEPHLIETKDIKANVIRAAITKLNRRGYQFSASERGLINEVIVTRIK